MVLWALCERRNSTNFRTPQAPSTSLPPRYRTAQPNPSSPVYRALSSLMVWVNWPWSAAMRVGMRCARHRPRFPQEWPRTRRGATSILASSDAGADRPCARRRRSGVAIIVPPTLPPTALSDGRQQGEVCGGGGGVSGGDPYLTTVVPIYVAKNPR
ncbi:unnamed protein product [Schistocephalus solidus]|uniref:Uncharacterized protein n=1 Tax=Schistocephalus solidus TaxID=70667 RepID=A0A183SVU2_SCHSO|nr:unnamed protein product [Schistocephalus solidus]